MNNGRTPTSRRRRRQKLVLQLIAAIGIGVGSAASAVQPRDSTQLAGARNRGSGVMLTSGLSSLLAQTPAQDSPLAPLPDLASDGTDEAQPAEPSVSPSDLAPPVAPLEVDADDDVAPPPPPAMPPQPTNIAASRSALGLTFGSPSAVPNMMGDLFGGLLSLQENFDSTMAIAGGDRRFKISENVSPIPQDRVFFNYNHFENALTDVDGVNHSLDRFTFGLEKTFIDGNASFEVRLPIVSGLDAFQSLSGDNSGVEVGNLGMYVKAILLSGTDWAMSGGLAMTVPTGNDSQANLSSDFVEIENDAVHLAPFLGYLTRPNRCWFAQGFIQADFDLNGNDVYDGTLSDRVYRGTVQEQNLLFVDASVGRWIHRSCDPCRGLRGVAAIAELHYTTTLNDTDTVSPVGNPYTVSNPYNRMDILNATGAVVVKYPKSSFRVGAAAPLRDGEERLFDAEIIFQFNRFF